MEIRYGLIEEGSYVNNSGRRLRVTGSPGIVVQRGWFEVKGDQGEVIKKIPVWVTLQNGTAQTKNHLPTGIARHTAIYPEQEPSTLSAEDLQNYGISVRRRPEYTPQPLPFPESA